MWGLAYKGQEGVELCLKLLADEIKLCMALAGTVNVRDITKEYLVKVSYRILEIVSCISQADLEQIDKSGFVARL